MRLKPATVVLRRGRSILRAGGLGAVLLLASFLAAAQTITEFTIPTAATNPFAIAPGPDGNLWFTETYGPGNVGRITTAGAITEFPVGFGLGIAAGADGNVWFVGGNGGKIGRITTAGVATEFNPPFTGAPQFVTVGPDGALWFTETPNRIARVFPSDPNTIVEFSSVGSASTFGGVTTGPDGNLWFTESDHSSKTIRIARIDLSKLSGCSANSSLCVTEFPVPGGIDVGYVGITSGPDGAIWFTDSGKVNRITTAGVITQFTAASATPGSGIAKGSDGALWYAGNGGKMGRITISGSVTEIAAPSQFSPRGVAAGPDGNIWFVEIGPANKIGRVNLSGGPPPPTPTRTPTKPSGPSPTPPTASLRGHVTPVAPPTPKSIANPRP